MLVLLKFDENRRIPNGNPERQAKAAFNFVKDAYECQASDEEAYCYDPTEDYADELDFVDGAINPDEIRKLAETWNQTICQDFQNALENMTKKTPTGIAGKPEYLQAPSTVIYDMKKAAMALDNDFYDYAEQALLITAHEYFTTILSQPECADIIAHPENFAAIRISIKS